MENQSKKELTLTRVFDAPRELVFKVWTDTKHLEQWWGPKGFTNPVCNFDIRPGGAIYVDMKAPDGTIYPMDGEFLEIVKPEKLVFICGALDKSGKRLFEVHNTITFTSEGNKTKVTLQFIVSKITPEAAPHLAGMDQGWNQSLDKLADYITKQK